MKVLFFSRLFYPHIGGVERHVLEISKVLIKKGHRVTVITENYDNLSKNDKLQGISIIRINAGKEGKLKKLRIWLQLLKHLDKIQSADIIHCHDIFFWYLPFRFLFPFKKIFTTFHGYEGNELPNKKAIFMHKIAEKLSKGNICIGNFYKKWYGTNATITSYGAVNSSLIKEGARNIKPSKDIVFIGRLENETGIMDYLNVLSAFKNRKINLNMDIYGEGSLEEKAIEFVVDAKLNVKFKGFDPNVTNKIKEYRYIFVSRYLGILEAMALRKPIFAVYNNAIKKDYLEMTPFAGFISISKNADEISKNILDYMNNDSNLAVEKAYGWVKNQTWENLVNKYLKLWNLKYKYF